MQPTSVDDQEDKEGPPTSALGALAAFGSTPTPQSTLGSVFNGVANTVSSALAAGAKRIRAPLNSIFSGSGDALVHVLGNLNVDTATSFIQTTALDHYDKARCGHCAVAVRNALQAGGIDLSGHPVDAADYKGFLDQKGFGRIDAATWVQQKGDVIVFKRAPGHPHGHIQMDIGNGVFASDFKQKGFYPAQVYKDMGTDGFVIYRHQSSPTLARAPASATNGNHGAMRLASANPKEQSAPAPHGPRGATPVVGHRPSLSV